MIHFCHLARCRKKADQKRSNSQNLNFSVAVRTQAYVSAAFANVSFFEAGSSKIRCTDSSLPFIGCARRSFFSHRDRIRLHVYYLLLETVVHDGSCIDESYGMACANMRRYP